MSRYAWASGTEWLINRIQTQTIAVRPSPPPEDADAQPLYPAPAYTPRQDFVNQVCADSAQQVSARTAPSASTDTCHYGISLHTRPSPLSSSGSTRSGGYTEIVDTASDRELQVQYDAPTLLPIQTLSPASSTLARRAVREKSAGLFWLYARREGPPHPCAMRRTATASATRPLWTRRVNPPSLLRTPKKQSTPDEERYLLTSLPEPFSLPNRLAHAFQFYLLLPDQPDQSPI